MYVLDVIPFSKSAPPGTLSYRSVEKLAPGALVSVLLRRKKVQAVVIECVPVAERKSELKRSTFMLASSEPVVEGKLSVALMEAAKNVAQHHATSVGLVLISLIGEYVRAEVLFPKQKKCIDYKNIPTQIEDTIEIRAVTYKTAIEEIISKGNTVQLIAPTLAEVIFWQEILSDFKPIVISGTSTPKQRLVLFEKARSHVGLVITTPTHAWLPLEHRALTILERLSAGSYQAITRPYLDHRVAVISLAEAAGASVCVGDFPLPLEYRATKDAPLTTLDALPISVIDVRAPADEIDKKPWKAVPQSLLTEIKKELAAGKNVAVLAVRKGYSPAVVCKDCGQTVTDERGRTLSFSTEQGRRVLRSNDGQTVLDAKTLCTRCGSWNLLPLGIGIERVEEELLDAFKGIPIISFSSEKLRTQTQAVKLLEPTVGKASIVVGTEAMLPWLQVVHQTFPISLSVIASSDTLLALPFWRARERFLRLALFTASLSTRLLIATRKPEDTVFDTFKKGSDGAFFKEETMLRKALFYPPFGTLITLTIEGTRSHIELVSEDIAPIIAEYSFVTLPDRPLLVTKFRRVFVHVVKDTVWPEVKLVRTLRQLPPSVRVLINPESL